MQKQPLRIFISHSSRDLPFTEKLAQDLRVALEDSEAVWYDSSNLSGGESWWPTVLTKLNQSNVCLLVCSPDAMKSHWIDDEINIAWWLRNKNRLFRLIPLLYQPCDLRPDLDTLQYISFLEPISYAEAFQKLLKTLGVSSIVHREQQENVLMKSSSSLPAGSANISASAPDLSAANPVSSQTIDRADLIGKASLIFTKRFSRRIILGGVAGLTGVAAVSTFVWQLRSLFVSSPLPPSYSKVPSQKITSVPADSTSTSIQRLETDPHTFLLTVDVNGLLTNSSQAINAVKQQIKGQSILQGRSVGMATAYGGALTVAEIGQALQIASDVYGILRSLGQEGFAFQRSSYNRPLYLLGGDPTHVTVEVYLFAR